LVFLLTWTQEGNVRPKALNNNEPRTTGSWAGLGWGQERREPKTEGTGGCLCQRYVHTDVNT